VAFLAKTIHSIATARFDFGAGVSRTEIQITLVIDLQPCFFFAQAFARSNPGIHCRLRLQIRQPQHCFGKTAFSDAYKPDTFIVSVRFRLKENHREYAIRDC
jgi:hypothetical protein